MNFSFADDIAPLKRNFFGTSKYEQGLLRNRYGPQIEKEQTGLIKIMQAFDQQRNSDLRYQSNLLALEQSREKSARDRETQAKLPSFFEDATNIMGNKDVSISDQQESLFALGMKYPTLLSTNQAAASMMAGASNILGSRIKAQTAATTRAGKQVDQILPVYKSAIKDIRDMSDALSSTEWEKGKKELTSADKVILKGYTKNLLDWDDETFDNFYQSGDQKTVVDSLLGQLVTQSGTIRDSVADVNVGPTRSRVSVDPNKFRSK
jgi:hypothetical protein